ncbi:MAG: hypothetical protein NZM39_10690 [Bernardetiaceae bacterium]|nr:hypothetical protein [Bernardetiaceae bacterium]
MKKTQLVTIFMVPVIVTLAYFLYAGIKSKVDEEREIKAREAAVIERLKEIREVQKWFLFVNGRYTASWDTLKAFIAQGKIPIVEKKETIIPRPPDKAYLGDSVRITYDTLRVESVREYLFPRDKYPNFNLETFSWVPGYNDPTKQFQMYAGKITQKGGAKVDVIEVVDPYPFDKTRREDHPNRKRRFLRFGSREEVSVTGNWED